MDEQKEKQLIYSNKREKKKNRQKRKREKASQRDRGVRKIHLPKLP